MTPTRLDVDTLQVTTFETDGPSQALSANQPACSDCFSTCNLLFSIYGC
jgi:hypothetical protein